MMKRQVLMWWVTSALILLHCGYSVRSQPVVDPAFLPPDLSAFFDQENSPVTAYAPMIQPNGMILVALFESQTSRLLVRFQTNGIPDPAFQPVPFHEHFAPLALQEDGKIIVGGSFTDIDGITRYGIARIDTDGTVDATFEANVSFGSPYMPGPGRVSDAAIDSKSNIVVGGWFDHISDVPRRGLARLLPDGSVDPAFDPLLPELNTSIDEIIVLPDDRILVSGDFILKGETERRSFVRLEKDGALDASFNSQAGSLPYPILHLALQPDGRILTSSNAGVIRLLPNGEIDPSFDAGNPGFAYLVPAPDGSVFISGFSGSVQGVAVPSVARLQQDGTLDLDFVPSGGPAGSYPRVSGLALQADGKVIVTGRFTSFDGVPANGIVRLIPPAPSGTTAVNLSSSSDYAETESNLSVNFTRVGDITFPISVQITSEDETAENGRDFLFLPQTLVFAPGERVKEVELVIVDNQLLDHTRTFRLNVTGEHPSLESGFNSTQIIIHDDEVEVVFARGGATVSESERFVDVGIYVRADEFIYRLNPKTFEVRIETIDQTAIRGRDYLPAQTVVPVTTGDPWRANMFTVEIMDNRLNDGDRTFGVGFVPPPGVFVGTNSTVTILDNDNAAAHGLGANGRIRAAVVMPDGKVLVGGEFTYLDGLERRFLARLMPDGTLDETFDAGEEFNDSVDAIALQSDGRIVVSGEFTEPLNHIARLNPDGSRDIAFNPGNGWRSRRGEPHVWSLIVDAEDLIYSGSSYDNFDDQLRPGLVRLLPHGTFDRTFDPPIGLSGWNSKKSGVYSLALESGGTLLVGGAFQVSNSAYQGILRLARDGRRLGQFYSGEWLIRQVALQPDGKILAATDSTIQRWLPSGVRDYQFLGDRLYGITDLVLLPGNRIFVTAGVHDTVSILDTNGTPSKVPPISLFAVISSTATLLRDNTILLSLNIGRSSADASSPFPLTRVTTNGVPVENLKFLPPVVREDEEVHLTLRGSLADRYVVERSRDLGNWIPVYTNTFSAQPPNLIDKSPALDQRMFYRVRRQ